MQSTSGDMKKILFASLLVGLMSCGGGSDDPGPTNPTDPEPTEESYVNCVLAGSNETLEIVTWNIENFPQSTSTAASVLQIIADTNPDVIALQEITSQTAFAALLAELTGWSGVLEQFNGSNLMLGYLFKDSEVTVTQAAMNLYAEETDDNDFAFTSFRRPLFTTIEHTSGLEVSLINVHLKCCNGSEDRRRKASELLKTYIDTNLADDRVMILGDYNDEIIDAQDNVFQNFIDDAANYRFATMDIAAGSNANWSYPSWPSMIDNILITDELFEDVVDTQVMKLDDCSNTYLNAVSDHRPVIINLRKTN
ncbi:MAG: hypothetical protein Roseis2KO_50840 [Roseivirga sp.]